MATHRLAGKKMRIVRHHFYAGKLALEVAIICAWILVTALSTFAGPYADSAHGNSPDGVSGYGVKRVASPHNETYARGNCGHCHEQHLGAEEFLLFAPNNPPTASQNLCFDCHSNASLNEGTLINANYSATFGGAVPTHTSIESVFSSISPNASIHDLSAVSTEIQKYWPETFGPSSNPCAGCHNPHRAQKNNNPGPYNASVLPKTAISLPGDHNSLWGDSYAESMKQYAENQGGEYRAPFAVGANPALISTAHEPDQVSRPVTSEEVKGATTPDYATFCLACHQYTMGTVRAIRWDLDYHGPVNGISYKNGRGVRIAPYTSDGTTSGTDISYGTGGVNFILSCLDCHEPHGSENRSMLRTTVNGKTGIQIAVTGEWYAFCTGCHASDTHKTSGACNTNGCHTHGSTRF